MASHTGGTVKEGGQARIFTAQNT